MSFSNISTVTRGKIATITVDRPKAHNALNTATLLELEEAITQLEADENIGAIIVTGAGNRSFIAGADIEEMRKLGGISYYLQFAAVSHRVFRRYESCKKPTIAAINGLALGGGAEFLLCLDIRFMAEEATIGFPEIGLGIFPGAGGTQRLTRQIPLCKAKELLMTAEAIGAQDALTIGLVNRVFAKEHLMKEAHSFASRVAGRPPLAMKLLKTAISEGQEMPHYAALDLERALIGLAFCTQDAREGLDAFVEKRTPNFCGA